MNKQTGIMYSRPVVGSLSAAVVAILLYGSNPVGAQAPQGIGIMYLEDSDAAGNPPYNWAMDQGLTNPNVQGIALRTQWNRVEPHEHVNADDFYWDYLDQGVALAAANGKKVSISVQAGVETPQWVYDAGASVFYVTEQFGYSAITDGVTAAGSTTVISAGDTAGWDATASVGLQIFGGSIPAGTTIVTVNASNNVTISAPATQSATGVAITTAMISPMPLPWDPIFQQKWGAFIQAFAARYGNNPNVAYVTMGGAGRRRESYFCFTPYDMAYFINTLGGLPNWQAGVQWIIDQYGTYFPNTPFILAMADPIPTPDGDTALKAVCDYGAAQHPGNHFGVMSCGLQYPNGPNNGSMGVTEVELLSPISTVGYCFYGPQGPYTDPATGRFMLDLGLERGFNFGAHFIEVYALDCNIPILAPVLATWGARMTATAPIPPASTSVPGDFNNDGYSDYLLYNPSANQTVIYYMNNNVLTSSTYGPTLPGGWQVAAVGDFNTDGHPDYLLFNPATGETVIYYMNNNVLTASTYGPTLPGGWSVVAVADFNLDGYPDYLLYDATTGATVIWYMHNNVYIGSAAGPTIPGGWRVAAVGDFNRDGHPDYLLFNPGTGETVIYYMNNNLLTASTYGPTLPGGWSVAGVADFNLDGYPDYLLYDPTTGGTVIWYMSDNALIASTTGPTVPGGWIPVAP
jgi:hypothetical protein